MIDEVGLVMDFAHPRWLWLLTAVPVLVLWGIRARRRRLRDWGRLAQADRPPGTGGLVGLGAVVCAILALAQPRWGRVGSNLPPGHDVVLAVDVSRSMAAEDAVPNRLGIAVQAAGSLVRELSRTPGPRAGLVLFAGRGVVRSPLTENLGSVLDQLADVRPGDVEPGGTDLGAALEAAAGVFDEQPHPDGRAIVVFSDGEDLAGAWREVLPRLREEGIVVHTVAIGDAEHGQPVPLGGPGRFVTYRGQRVLSRRSDAALGAIARETGGSLVPLGLAAADLGALYRTRIAPAARRARDLLRPPERIDRFPFFVFAALALSVAGSWPGRRRLVSRRSRGRWRRWWPLGLFALLVIGAAPEPTPPRTVAQAITEGRAAYARGDFATALTAFEAAVRQAPDAAVPRYDSAATLFRLGRYREALVRYREARDRADPALRTKIDYALGNTLTALRAYPAALRAYGDCLASRERGAALDAVRRDAAINKRFVEELERNPPRGPSPESGSDPERTPSRQPSSEPKSDPSATPKASSPRGGPQGQDESPGGLGRGAETPNDEAPEAQLADAIEKIREARKRRLGENSHAPQDPNRKDW